MINQVLQLDEVTKKSDGLWSKLADRALDGQLLDCDDALRLLRSDDDQLLAILAAAYRVRHHYFGNRVHLNFLINAKSGNCSENCGYCSQSKISTAEIAKYNLVDKEKLLDGARMAADHGSKTYCIVISGRSPTQRELSTIATTIPLIKEKYKMAVCASVGLLNEEQASMLKSGGVDRVNHNLNTSRRFYSSICTTHDYQQRLDTLDIVRRAGMEICSGGIIGMGEEDIDVVELALELGRLKVEATPINFLQPIDGTRLEGTWRLNPRYCLKVLSLFRLANPQCELRIAAGREMHLGPLQPLGLYPANSIFVGDYLTTKGQPPADDMKMIESLGFEAVTN